ncbi:MAG: membrane dipeptidase [Syntrophomonadaceae bacterium]|jgi:membrane dipeptidase|nr:membrane dipeptidase [Syntrophomonadaceae bacterium]
MGIVDCHCDIISRLWQSQESLYTNSGQFDLYRARQAGVVLQFCALFTAETGDGALRSVLNQWDYFYQELAQNQDRAYSIRSWEDIAREPETRIGCLIHLEGGEALGRDAGFLRLFYHLGLRSIGLTWNHRNLLADGVMEDASQGGLSHLGRQVVELAQELGMVIDLAHISERGFFDVLDLVDGPVMVSHSNARRICDHPRNLSDGQLQALAENGGIVGCTLVPGFVGPGEPGLDEFIDHMVHISYMVGVEHVALGSDFDGVDTAVLPDVSAYIAIPPALQQRGFNQEEIDKILKDNVLNLLEKVLK